MIFVAGSEKIARRDPERVRKDILRIAMEQFVEHGFGGARVDEIARQTRTTKRMIYYYYESKDSLFRAVLNQAFQKYRNRERDIKHATSNPVEAIRIWAELRFENYCFNSELFRICAKEDSHAADYMQSSDFDDGSTIAGLSVLTQILRSGMAQGLFRTDLDVLDVRITSSSYASFHSVFRGTFQTLYSRDMMDPGGLERDRRLAGDIMVATLTTFPPVRPEPPLIER